jgi:hypothetical protein
MLVSVLLGCTPAPSPSPSITTPPTPADFVPWPDIVWRLADVPFRPGGLSERVVAVTATDAGFVAVGYREADGVRDGTIWRSVDGDAWELVDDPILAGVELVDVAPAPNGVIALGVESTGARADHPRAVAFRSEDGSSWTRLPPLVATGDTYPAAIAGGPDGAVAVGNDASGASAIWRSEDGRTFERIAIGDPQTGGVVDPQVVPNGFVGLGRLDGPPTFLHSGDGAVWTSTAIDPRSDAVATRLIVGRWGMVAQGIVIPSCDEGTSCPSQSIAWWSVNGAVWGRLPGEGSPISNGASIVVPAGNHGLLAVDGANAWSSPDGWAWRALPEPADGSIVVDHAVVRGDTIIAVGAEYGEDGSSVGRILVAR